MVYFDGPKDEDVHWPFWRHVSKCSKCVGCRAKIVAAPWPFDCRSQIDMAVDVDYRRLVRSVRATMH